MDWLREVVEATIALRMLEVAAAEEQARRAAAWRYAHHVEGLSQAGIVRAQQARLEAMPELAGGRLGVGKDSVRRALQPLDVPPGSI